MNNELVKVIIENINYFILGIVEKHHTRITDEPSETKVSFSYLREARSFPIISLIITSNNKDESKINSTKLLITFNRSNKTKINNIDKSTETVEVVDFKSTFTITNNDNLSFTGKLNHLLKFKSSRSEKDEKINLFATVTETNNILKINSDIVNDFFFDFENIKNSNFHYLPKKLKEINKVIDFITQSKTRKK